MGDDDEGLTVPEFIATEGNGVRLVLDEVETHVIRQLTQELRALLDGGRIDRGDPVYERLFPATYDDTKDESAFRELIGDDLVTFKLEALDTVAGALGDAGSDVTLDGETLDIWLACLTDLRLAIGTRLNVDEDRMAAEVDPRDPDARSLAVLHWLGFVQEGVVRSASHG